MIPETRERFLVAIAAQVPPEHIAEIHFFSPIKQGGMESGVAVVAAEREPVVEMGDGREEMGENHADGSEEAREVDEAEELEEVEEANLPSPRSDPPSRLVIYTARYRLTLKGPDRGKWETNVVAEADAPLVTVEAVVRGVQRRSGDVDDPARMDGDEARSILEARASVIPSAARDLPSR